MLSLMEKISRLSQANSEQERCGLESECAMILASPDFLASLVHWLGNSAMDESSSTKLFVLMKIVARSAESIREEDAFALLIALAGVLDQPGLPFPAKKKLLGNFADFLEKSECTARLLPALVDRGSVSEGRLMMLGLLVKKKGPEVYSMIDLEAMNGMAEEAAKRVGKAVGFWGPVVLQNAKPNDAGTPSKTQTFALALASFLAKASTLLCRDEDEASEVLARSWSLFAATASELVSLNPGLGDVESQIRCGAFKTAKVLLTYSLEPELGGRFACPESQATLVGLVLSSLGTNEFASDPAIQSKLQTHLAGSLSSLIGAEAVEINPKRSAVADFAIRLAAAEIGNAEELKEAPGEFVERVEAAEEGDAAEILRCLVERRFFAPEALALLLLQGANAALASLTEPQGGARDLQRSSVELISASLLSLSHVGDLLSESPRALELMELFVIASGPRLMDPARPDLIRLSFFVFYQRLSDSLFRSESQRSLRSQLATAVFSSLLSSAKQPESPAGVCAFETLSSLLTNPKMRAIIAPMVPTFHRFIETVLEKAPPLLPPLIFNLVQTQWHYYFSNPSQLKRLVSGLISLLDHQNHSETSPVNPPCNDPSRMAFAALKPLLSLTANKAIATQHSSIFLEAVPALLGQITKKGFSCHEEVFEILYNVSYNTRTLAAPAASLLSAFESSLSVSEGKICDFVRLFSLMLSQFPQELSPGVMDSMAGVIVRSWSLLSPKIAENEREIASTLLTFHLLVQSPLGNTPSTFRFGMDLFVWVFSQPELFSNEFLIDKFFGVLFSLCLHSPSQTFIVLKQKIDFPSFLSTLFQNFRFFETLYERKLLLSFLNSLIHHLHTANQYDPMLSTLSYSILLLKFFSLESELDSLKSLSSSTGHDFLQNKQHSIDLETRLRKVLGLFPRLDAARYKEPVRLREKIRLEEGLASPLYVEDQALSLRALVGVYWKDKAKFAKILGKLTEEAQVFGKEVIAKMEFVCFRQNPERQVLRKITRVKK